MTTTTQDLAAARLALAERWPKMRKPHSCSRCVKTDNAIPSWDGMLCDGRGWVPAVWPLQVLIAEAAKEDASLTMHDFEQGQSFKRRTFVLGHSANGKVTTEFDFVATDYDSIMLAALKALTEVMP